MTRRRRRIGIQSSSLYVLLIVLLSSGSSQQHSFIQNVDYFNSNNNNQAEVNGNSEQFLSAPSHHHHQNNTNHGQLNHNHQHHQNSNHNHNSNNNHHHNHHQHQHQQHQQTAIPSAAQLCSMLPIHVAKLMRLCKLVGHSPAADEALTLGAARGLAECRNQFKSERWNCTHSQGDQHLLTGELAQSIGNRESGFVYAITAAGIVHSIATACSAGSLSDCACDKTRIGLIRRQEENWKWGGCSNNIRHGMAYAKHLVELLDAVHRYAPIEDQNYHQLNYGRQLSKRSLSSKNREPNQLRFRQQQQQQLVAESTSLQQQQQQSSFCQKNHNISQATHLQLIKSLLSKNSLKKHHEFRLAMNMHNSKVGRLAVAKNMELRCRCHGLSGSCSLKTCWLTLPNFQVIGAYLKKKYESSVHLPSAVNLNKLIPMMDKNEISAILSSDLFSNSPAAEQLVINNHPSGLSTRSVVLGATPSQQSSTTINRGPSHNQVQFPAATEVSIPAHYNYYERHKFLQMVATNQLKQSAQPNYNQLNETQSLGNPINTNVEPPETQQEPEEAPGGRIGKEALDANDDLPVNVSPMSQQQYQALLREVKLCNNNNNNNQARMNPNSTTITSTSNLTREVRELGLNQKQQSEFGQQHNWNHRKSLLAQSISSSGQYLKNANHHLSQALHSTNRDDLIYLHKSPDYCEADSQHGFAGIKSRVCSDNPSAPDNCDKLCCGRGHTTRVYQHQYKCDCKFQYCCSIWCAVCEEKVTVLVCN